MSNGAESSDPSLDGCDLDRVSLRGDALTSVDLRPTALKEVILSNREALLSEMGIAI